MTSGSENILLGDEMNCVSKKLTFFIVFLVDQKIDSVGLIVTDMSRVQKNVWKFTKSCVQQKLSCVRV